MIATGGNSTNRIVDYPGTEAAVGYGDMGLVPAHEGPAPIRYAFNTTKMLSPLSLSIFYNNDEPSTVTQAQRAKSVILASFWSGALVLWPPGNTEMALRWSTALALKRGSCLSMLGRSKQVVGVRPSSYPLNVCKRSAGTKQNKFVEVRYSCI